MAYNPDLQALLLRKDMSIASLKFNESIPQLKTLVDAYGIETPVEWLKIELGMINDFAETKVKMTSEQFHELATVLVSGYGYLNAAEVILFIARFKAGMYGSFYGAIDPLKITSALQEFLMQRKKSIDGYIRDKEMADYFARRDEWAKEAVSYEEYQKIKDYEDSNSGCR